MERKSNPTEYERQAKERIQWIVDVYCDGSQQQLVEKTGVNKGSISQYINGKNVPSNITAKKLAEPFGLNPAWVMGFDVPKFDSGSNGDSPSRNYYFDDATAAKAQELFDNKDLRMLFEAAQGASPEDLHMAATLLAKLKKTNPELSENDGF